MSSSYSKLGPIQLDFIDKLLNQIQKIFCKNLINLNKVRFYSKINKSVNLFIRIQQFGALYVNIQESYLFDNFNLKIQYQHIYINMFCISQDKASFSTTKILLILILFTTYTLSEPSGQARLLQADREKELLKQMAKIYDQKMVIYENWQKDTQSIAKPLLKKFDQLDRQLEQAIQKTNPSLKERLDEMYKFSPIKEVEFKNLENQIKEIQRIRDFRFHLHQSYLSKTQPICPPRVKLTNAKPIQIPKASDLAKYNKIQDLIIVTPNGQKAYLQIIFKHLLKQKDSFYQWHLWVGKNSEENIKYMEKLEAENNWVKVKKLPSYKPQNWKNMKDFWFSDCQPNKVYLRIENDTVWLSNDFVSKMFQARIAYPDHLLIYANIINNGLIDHINQHAGNFNFTEIAHHHCQGTGWGSIQIVKQIHDQFLNSIERNTTSKFARSFQKWLPLNYQQISMNSVIYFSNTILSLNNQDKEQDKLFSVDYPFTYQKPNLIVGNAICVNHMDDYQKEFLEKEHPEILSRYRQVVSL